MEHRAYITGMGILSSIGKNINEFTKSLANGNSGIDWMDLDYGEDFPVRIGAQLKGLSSRTLMDQLQNTPDKIAARVKKVNARAPYSLQATLLPVIEAWHDANLDAAAVEPDKISLVVAGSNISQQYQYSIYKKYADSLQYVTPSYTLHFMDTDHVGTITELLNIHGEGLSVGGASAGGNVALIKGLQAIKLGICDVCIVVGPLTDLSPLELQGFYNLGALGGKNFHNEPSKACRPFDKNHEGFIYGQAAGCIVLESEQSASKRNARVYAQLLGGSLVCAGNHLSDPSEDAEVKAMTNAIENANIHRSEIQYINAHATSTPMGDIAEASAIKRVFGQTLDKIWINATKGLTGHCLYSAGVIEAIATVIQMNGGFLHGNKNLYEPIDFLCRFCGRSLEHAKINLAMSNSFAFGGINTSIIIKRGM